MRSQIQDVDALMYTLDFNHDSIEKALHKTAEYVSKHKLLLTGGTAIDMALRTKGLFLYDDNALPDYDIVSDENLKHATQLAKLLCEQGFHDINVISAIHVTTVRVRIKNVTLLDATFMPKNLYERIPYMDVQTHDFEFRVVSPNYQKIDQRLSLATLTSDTGISLNIFNRLIKDLKRNQILRDAFDIPEPKFKSIQMKRVKLSIKNVTNEPNTFEKLDHGFFISNGDACLSAFAAYALYYYEFCKERDVTGIINPNVQISDQFVEFDLPKESRITVLNSNNNALSLFKKLEPKNKYDLYNPLLNAKPTAIRGELYEVQDSYGRRIGAGLIENIVVACADYLQMEFLRDSTFGDTQLVDANLSYYHSLQFMIEEQRKQEIEYEASVWMPTISCYGIRILPEYKAMAYERIVNFQDAALLKPKNSYLRVPECKVKSNFDHQQSHYFMIDGLINNQMKHTNLKWTLDKIEDGNYEI